MVLLNPHVLHCSVLPQDTVLNPSMDPCSSVDRVQQPRGTQCQVLGARTLRASLANPPPKDRVLVPAPAPTKTGGWTRHFQWGLVQSTTNTNSFNSQWSGLYDVYLKSLVCSSRPRPRSRVVVAPAPKQPSSRAGLRTSRPSIWRGGWWQRWCGASERGMWHRLARQLLPRKNSMKRDIPVCF